MSQIPFRRQVRTHFIRFPLDVYIPHVRHRLTAVSLIPSILRLLDGKLSTTRDRVRQMKRVRLPQSRRAEENRPTHHPEV